MNRPLKLSLAVALALVSPSLWALGLGPIEVHSGLNQPLRADIPVIESDPDEAIGLKAALASAEEFKRVGVELSGLSVSLTFDVIKNARGQTVIHVTSDDAIKEPVLGFLMSANWGRGRLLREYQLLLDPPVVAPAIAHAPAAPIAISTPEPVALQPEPMPAPREAAAAPSEPVSTPVAAAPAPEPIPAVPAPAEPVAAEPEAAPVASAPVEPAPIPAPTAAAGNPGEYGPVASGETLWEIANAARSDNSISVNQMMLAIQRANADAFIGGNVNALKRGAILRIPGVDEARSTSAAAANAEIAAQAQSWSGRSAPARVAETQSAPSPSSKGTRSGSDSSPPESASRVQVVPPSSGSGKNGSDRAGSSSGTDNSAALRADLKRAEEQIAAREAEARELRSRVGELENIQKDSKKLVELKDSKIAELSEQLRKVQAQVEQDKIELARATAASTAAATSPVPVQNPIPAPTAANLPPTSTPTTSEAPVVPATSPTSSTEPPVTPPVATTTPEPTVPAETHPVESTASAPVSPIEPAATPAEEAAPWWKSPWIAVSGVGAVVLGLLLLFGLRRRTAAEPSEPSLAAIDEPRGPSVADQFEGGVFGARSSAADLAHDDAFAAPRAGAVDREHQLLESLAQDPTDLDSHLELLGYYHSQHDVEKFEAAAEAMFTQVGNPNTPAWQRVVEMGQSLSPGHPLFEAMPAPPPAPSRKEWDFDMVDRQAPAAPPAPAARPATPEPEAEAFDFNLMDTPSVAPASPAPPPPRHDVTLDLHAPNIDVQAAQVPEMRVEHDFTQPDLGMVAAEVRQRADAGESFMAGEDAVRTKLDLARAYLDMGDSDGARSMLQEVMTEGNSAQKDEARRLLSEVG